MALNSIGPAVVIARRGGGWCVRFRFPEHVARRYSLPRRPRLGCRLPDDASNDRLVREANRIGAMLDMLLREKSAPADEQSLAAWLGLPEPARKRPTRSSSLSDLENVPAIERQKRGFVLLFLSGTVGIRLITTVLTLSPTGC